MAHDELAKVRSDLEQARGELEGLDERPIPRSEWLARIAAAIDRREAEAKSMGAFRLSALRTPGPRGAERLLAAPVRSGVGGDVAEADLFDVALVLLGSDALKTRLAELARGIDYDEGPPLEDRPEIKARLVAEIERLEVVEELAVRSAEDAGLDVIRRGDADPRIVLAWQDELEAREHGTGTKTAKTRSKK
mgnify:CR=1 FL=1